MVSARGVVLDHPPVVGVVAKRSRRYDSIGLPFKTSPILPLPSSIPFSQLKRYYVLYGTVTPGTNQDKELHDEPAAVAVEPVASGANYHNYGPSFTSSV
jgi:hypothetical protein